MWTSGEGRRAVAFLGTALFAYYLLILGGHHYSIDGIYFFQASKALLFRGSLIIDPPIRWEGADIRVGHWAIGMTLAYLPLLLFWSPVFKAFPALELTPYDPAIASNPDLYRNLAYLLCSPLNPMITAATACATFALARSAGLTARWSAAAAMVFAIASPAATYSRYDFSQPLAGLAVTIAAWQALRFDANRRVSSLLLSGIAAGVLLLTRIELLPAAGWIGLWLLVPLVRRREWNRLPVLLAFAAPIMAAGAAHRWVQSAKLGGSFTSASPLEAKLATWFSAAPADLLEGLAGQLISPGRGLLVFFPAAILVIPGLRALRRQPAVPALFAGVLGIPLLLYSSFRMWWAGICWGPRFMVPFLSLICVAAVAFAGMGDGNRTRRRRLLGGLAAIGFVISWNGILTDPNVYTAWTVGRFGVEPASGPAQFRLVPSPLISGWPWQTGARIDVTWVRLWNRDASTLLTPDESATMARLDLKDDVRRAGWGLAAALLLFVAWALVSWGFLRGPRMHVPAPVKSALRQTPLYPAYRRWAPGARSLRDRSSRRLQDWARALRGLPPLPPPLPPPRLIELVAGNTDPDWFLRSGRMGADSISAILAKNGLAFGAMGTVLDFGCGVGRVLRHWSDVQGPRLHGSDYNAELIQWCLGNLRFATFNVNPLEGALPYAPGAFDFIYALSVFTHLTPGQQDFWMRELGRILRPGGHLLISTHGEHYLKHLSADDQAAFKSGRQVVVAAEFSGTNVCATYHPPCFVRDHLAASYTVVDLIPEGAQGNPWQDYWLLRKPA